MVGVICGHAQRSFVEEFFELFKTPWEFHVAGTAYDVIIVTRVIDAIPDATLVIVCGSQSQAWDPHRVTPLEPDRRGLLLAHGDRTFPVYRTIARVEALSRPLVHVAGSTAVVGTASVVGDRQIIRLGYDPFDEAGVLLTEGQPARHAETPTLDVHIDLLRQWIVQSGVPVIEIPPLPDGCDFAVCLTHDVDFVNLRDHGLDRSLVGFIFRALIPLRLRDTNSRLVWSRLFRNWLAVLSIPAVYLRLCRDVWFDIDRYQEIEKGLGATYFVIPFKNVAGEPLPGERRSALRAAPYDARFYASLIEDLVADHAEIATHGIDAWRDSDKGREERGVVNSLSGQDSAGVRMHWLYFTRESPQVLERSGFGYDSTIGYNEAIGFRSGTTQVFRLPETAGVFELPLNVMDSALFYRGRMGLSEADAFERCEVVIGAAKKYGGALTINWHTRSLRPERNWDSFYVKLVEAVKSRRVWFATAGQAVSWFKARRGIHFDRVSAGEDGLTVSLSVEGDSTLPGFVLRWIRPARSGRDSEVAGQQQDYLVPVSSNTGRALELVLPSRS